MKDAVLKKVEGSRIISKEKFEEYFKGQQVIDKEIYAKYFSKNNCEQTLLNIPDFFPTEF